MKTIWKFPVHTTDTLPLPADAKFLSVQIQRDEPVMWFELDLGAKREWRTFKVFGTGHDFEDGRYLGTWQDEMQGLVWHLYETTPAGR